MRGIPSRFAGGGAPAADPGLYPWIQIQTAGGNVVNASAPAVDGILHVSGEALTTDWIYLPVRATATATLTAGVVTALTLVLRGQLYTSAPTVTISPPVSGTTATATVTLEDYASVVAVKVTACGSGYWNGATVTFSAPTSGTTASGVAVVRLGKVVGIQIINPGSGYTSDPTVTITAVSGGSGATATTITERGRVATITIGTGGSGYGTTVPTVTIDAPDAEPYPLTMADGIGWGTVTNSNDVTGAGPVALLVNDDRSTIAFPLVVSVVDSGITVQGSDPVLSWVLTYVRFDDQDADADGILPCWVPMGGAE